VWNGHQAQVYQWLDDMGDNIPIQVAKFSSTAAAMALREETIFRAVNNSVELCNLQGVVRQKISFSKGEGTPTHLDVNGDFLAVATNTGLIKIFQVRRREPKQLGSPGRFHLGVNEQNSIGQVSSRGRSKQTTLAPQAIRSICCNADGTRVSIIADHVPGRVMLKIINGFCATLILNKFRYMAPLFE